MIEIKTYRGHIRNWQALCAELGIDAGLSLWKAVSAGDGYYKQRS